MLGVQRLGPVAPKTGVGEPIAPGGPVWPTDDRIETRLRVSEARGDDLDRRAERDAWVVLTSVPGLGPITFATLLRVFGSATQVLATAAGASGETRLLEAVADRDASGEAPAGRALSAELARRIRDQVAESTRIVGYVRGLGLEIVTLDDPAYPARLRSIEIPPPLLFVRGAVEVLSASHTAAVVGTRWPTDRGRLTAGWIASGLARAGAVVVSGLAVGIDGVAHAAVVADGLPTVAVLGGGHARLFPRAHERLADAIVAAGGAVVAEMSPDTPATRGTFPRRNRLISGLSDATIVVEAGRRSGALITAGWALEQGRECLLVPGPLDAPTSAGCNAFLRSYPGQARVVCGIPELLEDLGLDVDRVRTDPLEVVAGAGPDDGGAADADPSGAAEPRAVTGIGRCWDARPSSVAPTAGRAAALATLAPVERSLAEILACGSATADELARRTSLASASILSALTLLELRGFVTSAYGRYSPAGALASWEPWRQSPARSTSAPTTGQNSLKNA